MVRILKLIKKAVEDMNQTVQKIGQAMYAAQQAESAKTTENTKPEDNTTSGDKGPEEAEFDKDAKEDSTTQKS